MTETILVPEKDIYVQNELAEAPLVLAIHFKEKKEEGVFFSSRDQLDFSPYFEIRPPDEFEPSVALVEEDLSEDSGRRSAGMIAGIGNRMELEALVTAYKVIFFNEINKLGIYGKISREIRLALASVMNNQFRQQNSDVPCRVELLIVTRYSDELEIFRMKSDGDFHPSPRFGVIGGYGKAKTGKLSIRATALKMLNLFYKTVGRPPTLKEADKIATLALAQDKRKMPYPSISILSF